MCSFVGLEGLAKQSALQIPTTAAPLTQQQKERCGEIISRRREVCARPAPRYARRQG